MLSFHILRKARDWGLKSVSLFGKASSRSFSSLIPIQTHTHQSTSFTSSSSPSDDNSPDFIAWSQISSSLHPALNQFAADNDKDGFMSYLQDFGPSHIGAAQHNAAWIYARRQLQSQQKEDLMNWRDTESFWNNIHSLFEKEIDLNLNVCINDIYSKNAFIETPDHHLMKFCGRNDAKKKFKQYVNDRLGQLSYKQQPKKIPYCSSFGSSGSGKTRLLHDIATHKNEWLLSDDNIINNQYDIEMHNTLYLPITYNTNQGTIHDIDGESVEAGFCWRILIAFVRAFAIKARNDNDYLNEIKSHFKDYQELRISDTINLIYNHKLLNRNYKIPLIVLVDEILKLNDRNDSITQKTHKMKGHDRFLHCIGYYYDTYNAVYSIIDNNDDNMLYELKKDAKNAPFCMFIISSLYGSGLMHYQSSSKRFINVLPQNLFTDDQSRNILKTEPLYVEASKSSQFSRYISYLISISGGFPTQLECIWDNIHNKPVDDVEGDKLYNLTKEIKGKMKTDAQDRAKTLTLRMTKIGLKSLLPLLRFKNIAELSDIDEMYDGLTTYDIFVSGMAKEIENNLVFPPMLLYEFEGNEQLKNRLSEIYEDVNFDDNIGLQFERYIRSYQYLLPLFLTEDTSNIVTLADYFGVKEEDAFISNDLKKIYSTKRFKIPTFKSMEKNDIINDFVKNKKVDIGNYKEGIIYHKHGSKGWDYGYKIFGESEPDKFDEEWLQIHQIKASLAMDTVSSLDKAMIQHCKKVNNKMKHNINVIIRSDAITEETFDKFKEGGQYKKRQRRTKEEMEDGKPKKEEVQFESYDLPKNTILLTPSQIYNWIHPQFRQMFEWTGQYNLT